ncbi:MAG: recombination protein RecR [Candidatus Aminicenantes bacterium]|nr:recombination protein RecR [Candidatus Aminicenantes bacterium]
METPQPLNRLIDELKKVPSIGAKSAQRIAFYILGLSEAEVENMAEAIREAKKKTILCSVCNGMTHADPCRYCTDPGRRDDVLCVVEEPFNINTIEKTGIFHGRYYVLHGALSPLKGKGPDELKTEKLLKRVEDSSFKEIIIATNPTVEGESTAVFLANLFKRFPIKITRLAMGLPVGSDLDYADHVTVKKALEGRTEMTE